MKSHIIMQGDAWKLAKMMPSESVQMIWTSPPYWGLRSYGHDEQFGLESTPGEYVEKLVSLFHELRRVLRDDGVLWLNLGDSYNGSGGPGAWVDNEQTRELKGEFRKYKNPNRAFSGLKPKDLVGIPWRVAFALQDDGWWLRSDTIWAKGVSFNPVYSGSVMPESVRDRPSKSHEYLFLLSKSQHYFYDNEAVKEPVQESTLERYKYGWDGVDDDGSGGSRTGSAYKKMKAGATMGEAMGGSDMRNIRSVWTINPKPYKGSHFAVAPPALIEPCVLAGTSEVGNCPDCGNPWVRIVERVKGTSVETPKTQAAHEARGGTGVPTGTVGKSGGGRTNGGSYTVGWKPTCECGKQPVPAVVLDPFMGSGTVAAVAITHGRHAVGFELNPDYIQLAEERIEKVKLEEGIEMPPLEKQLSDLPLFTEEGSST